MADFNGDGIPDIEWQPGNSIEIYAGEGNGHFADPLAFGSGPTPTFVLPARLQGQAPRSGKSDYFANRELVPEDLIQREAGRLSRDVRWQSAPVIQCMWQPVSLPMSY